MKLEHIRRTAVQRPLWLAWSLLVLGVIAASVSAILIRYAVDAPPLAQAFWRCAVGGAVLLPAALRRLAALERRRLVLPALAGVFLALHFGTWITSVTLTTVAESVLLLSTAPVFVALAAWALFQQRLVGRGWAGIAVAVVGAVLVGSAGGGTGESSLTGNALALAGAVTVAGYTLAGSIARRSLGILEYATVTYLVAAVLLLAACVGSNAELSGYDAQTWWAIAGLIVGPQLLGHTVINLILKDIDATTVSVTIMAEPVIASVLAYVLFAEIPSALALPGGAAILAGIYLVTAVTRARPPVVIE